MRSYGQTMVVAGLAAILVALPTAAWARFTAGTQAAMSVSSASLAAPTNVSVSKTCHVFGLGGGDSLTMNWAPSTSQAVTGYSVYFNADTGQDITKTVSGRTTTSVTASIQYGTTYTITVSSVVRNWTADSTPVSAMCTWWGT